MIEVMKDEFEKLDIYDGATGWIFDQMYGSLTITKAIGEGSNSHVAVYPRGEWKRVRRV